MSVSVPKAGQPTSDVLIVAAKDFGVPASRAELATMPVSLKANTHSLQRGRITEIYRDTLTGWGTEVQGLPLIGDGFVVIFRTDRLKDPKHLAGFRTKFLRDLEPPTTWEDIAEIAAYFAEADGKPSLPPLPTDPDELLTQFQQIAACYDRKARSESSTGEKLENGAVESPGFQFSSGTWQPRIGSASFRAAAAWLQQTNPYRMTVKAGEASSPLAAIENGSAVVAVLTLAELANLPKDPATGAISAKFQLTALPGTRTYFNAAGQSVKTTGPANYIPFVGAHTMVGAVRKTCAYQDAAWDLLAELASPSASTTTLSDLSIGSGPFRREHVEQGRDNIWLVYSFEPARHQRLADAMRSSMSLSVSNPAIVLRTPDQAELSKVWESFVRQAATGKLPPDVAMQQAEVAWKALDAKQKPEELVKARRNSVGLP